MQQNHRSIPVLRVAALLSAPFPASIPGTARRKVLPLNNSNSRKLLALDGRSIVLGESV